MLNEAARDGSAALMLWRIEVVETLMQSYEMLTTFVSLDVGFSFRINLSLGDSFGEDTVEEAWTYDDTLLYLCT